MLKAEGRRALDDLRKFATELGAEDGRIIATNKVVVENRVSSANPSKSSCSDGSSID